MNLKCLFGHNRNDCKSERCGTISSREQSWNRIIFTETNKTNKTMNMKKNLLAFVAAALCFFFAGCDSREVAALKKAAEQGDADAQLKLSTMYAKGEGVPKSNAKAVDWFQRASTQYQKDAEQYEKAARQGDTDAQFKLAIMCIDGRGIPKDEYKAGVWLQCAAEKGHEKAAERLQEAAEQGHAWAQYPLGKMYAKGQGISQSDTKALEWYQKAAAQDYDNAKERMNWLLEKITNEKAAEKGDAEAQFQLGWYYYSQLNDEAKAAEWFKKAVAQGHEKAKGWLK